ncbi:DUF4249 domain-containing protein [Crocinitomicaceae bacterium]|nr:DUF4249 domain-containing protein [Crocinitomicaceae bacterium]MDB3907555.1 DUF4249 domain-containing protein [Crocinitomicaceae bacterium]MDC0257383.1 DUF4249 domain-containing protein [Crocinitomicaceae bacterium]
MRKLAYILGLVVLASSCQKVIDVDLNEGNQNIVIEGNYTGEDSTVRVGVTLTSSYFNNDPSPTVDNALVTITDQNGIPTVVPSAGNGQYVLSGYAPDYGTSYTLSVVYDGATYSAACSMPTPVQMDPITYQYLDGFFGADPGYVSILNFQDPELTTDFYQIVITENGTSFDRIDQIQTQDDALTNGNYIQRPLFLNELSLLGDTISYEFRTVDKAIFDYTFQAADIAGGSNSAAPGNPITNWDNGALGYFSAYGVSRDSVVIQ